MLKALLTIAIFLPAATPALAADSCSPVRIDQGALARVPVYDQQGIDNCYAFAVAQAADAWRFSQGDHRHWRLTSPTHLSVLYAYEHRLLPLEVAKDFGTELDLEKRMAKASLSRGSPVDAFATLRRHGSCDLKGFIEHRDQLLVESIWIHVRRLAALAEKEQREVTSEEIQCFQEGLTPFQNSKHLIRAFTGAMEKKYPLAIMKQAAEKICAKRRLPMHNLPATLGTDENNDTPAERIRLLHAALDQSPAQPPLVSYCARLLSNRDARATAELKPSDNPCRDRPGKFDGHVSLVVGRRKIEGGKCQLLIRNSWGKGCQDIIHKKPYAWECEGGQIWVDEDALANNAYYVSYLPARKADATPSPAAPAP